MNRPPTDDLRARREQLRLRSDQLREHERLRALGFTVVVLDSKNLEGILCEKSNDAVNSA